MTLVTKNKNLEELGRELSRIYVTLYNSKRLSVRPAFWHVAVNQPTFSIEKLFRSEGLFYGKTFPQEIDDLACDINPTTCTRELVPAPSDKLTSLTDHISGFLPSQTQWRAQPSMTLLVPDVQLTPDIEWFSIQKDPKKPMDAIVVDELGGCEQFDDHCRILLQFYNRTLGDKLFDPTYRGSVALPVLTLEVATNVASAAEIPNLPGASPPVTTPDSRITLQPVPGSNLKSADSFKVLQGIEARNDSWVGTANQATKVLKQLNNNVIPKVAIQPFQEQQTPLAGAALFPADVDGYRKGLYNLLAVPDALRQMPFPDEFLAPIGVGVIDSRIDEKHCAFEPGQLAVQNASAAPNLGPPAHCDLRVTGDQVVDHATHVAGIIASHYGSGATRVPIGLDPYAKIYSMEIDFAGLNDEQIAKRLKRLIQEHQLKVVNMSFGYLLSAQNPDLQPTDVLEQPIAGLQGTTLFVAAAGNGGADKSYICDLRPACFDLPNVIAVAGIDRSPDTPTLLQSDAKQYSNFGRRIHIAAIGKDVFSTVANGRYGLLTGTSQAAPQVTAVASLMTSKYPTLLPAAIKNRLIYCSDLLESLRDKLFGGRLNAECALDGDSGRLQLSSAPKVQHGRFQPTSVFHFTDEKGDVDIPVQLMRSMSYDPMRASYTVFYAPRNLPDVPLLRASNLVFKNPAEKLRYNFSEGNGAFITVEEITRYVAPIQ
ncbi:S8 family peptidase [Bradyrhizobium sp. HKCCYLRH1073]|uniref:S8 family peptidase n=1 Tax=unclassified Bradyrhizobium TaxID=2631580 RepID=UPI002916A069|nr:MULTISPECIES: S8/S53 family peptidase [unclassified Bradyrhizobium]